MRRSGEFWGPHARAAMLSSVKWGVSLTKNIVAVCGRARLMAGGGSVSAPQEPAGWVQAHEVPEAQADEAEEPPALSLNNPAAAAIEEDVLDDVD